jgi:hypothetical protein
MIDMKGKPMTPAQERVMLLESIKELQGSLAAARNQIAALQHHINHLKRGSDGHPMVRE